MDRDRFKKLAIGAGIGGAVALGAAKLLRGGGGNSSAYQQVISNAQTAGRAAQKARAAAGGVSKFERQIRGKIKNLNSQMNPIKSKIKALEREKAALTAGTPFDTAKQARLDLLKDDLRKFEDQVTQLKNQVWNRVSGSRRRRH